MKTLESSLENWQVHDPGMWENELTGLMPEWYAVSNADDAIVAYFSKESDAYRFRLAEVNRELNG